jgi:hypothetical protein
LEIVIRGLLSSSASSASSATLSDEQTTTYDARNPTELKGKEKKNRGHWLQLPKTPHIDDAINRNESRLLRHTLAAEETSDRRAKMTSGY